MSAEQASLGRFQPSDPGRGDWSDRAHDLLGIRGLTLCEAEALVAVDDCGHGVREFARRTNRSPGTVSNLLRRARQKAGDWA